MSNCKNKQIINKKHATATFIIALTCNILLASALFLLIPHEKRRELLAVVQVGIEDYKLPDLEEINQVDESVNNDDDAQGDDNAETKNESQGTSIEGSDSGGGGTAAERILQNALSTFAPQPMLDAARGGAETIERTLTLENIIRDMTLIDGINKITVPKPDSNGLAPGVAVSDSFKGRMGRASKRASLRKYGGDMKTEDAVEKALKFLASKQNQDGSWGSKESFKTTDSAALSGFALLAFLSHGETFESKEYADNIKKAVSFLIKLANTQGIENAGKGFGHAILTYALAEAYAMTGMLELKKVVEERLKSIIARQNKFGSFAENYDNKPHDTPPPSESDDPKYKEIIIGEPACDLSLLGWHVQALTAAKNAGIEVEGLDGAFEKALEAIVRIHQAKNGGFSGGINMRRFESDENMNPVGFLALQFLNSASSAPAKRVARLVIPDKKTPLPKWRGAGAFPLYRWYYQTQTVFQHEKGSGKKWEEWNNNMKSEMLENQHETGAWFLPANDRTFAVGNRDDLAIYATSISALILQTYYRYLPTYSIAEASGKSSSFADLLEKGIGGYIRRLPGDADPLADLILGIGSSEVVPIQFGAFDSKIKNPDTPHAPERFKTFASFASTISVRDVLDWPQTLQPKQRIALFIDDFLPEDYKGNLMLSISYAYVAEELYNETTNCEIVVNGRRVYYAHRFSSRNFINVFIPKKFLAPSGNIIQFRNTGSRTISFDGARLASANKPGKRLLLGAEYLEELPDDLRPRFNISLIVISTTSEKNKIFDRMRHARLNGAVPIISLISSVPDDFTTWVFPPDTIFEVQHPTTGVGLANMEKLHTMNPDAKIIHRDITANEEDMTKSLSVSLASYAEERSLAAAVDGMYSPESDVIGTLDAFGSEDMGNEFQRNYLHKSAREILEWLATGGSGIMIRNIMDGGKYYDKTFKTPYPALDALKQVSKIFDGNPRQLPLAIYAAEGNIPLLYTYAAASANAPGVVTIAVGKRFKTPERTTLHTIVPWNGETRMVIEKGFFDAKSPYVEQFGAMTKEESIINIENNSFEHTGIFDNMTVIRLTQKLANEPVKTKSPYTYKEPEIKDTVVMAELVNRELPKGYEFITLRETRAHTTAFGNNASFSVIPASTEDKARDTFTPHEPESIEVSFRTGNKTKRFDSVFMLCGAGCDDAEFLTFMVFPKMTTVKKNDPATHVPISFAFSGKVFRSTLQVGKWQRISVPLKDVKAPRWENVRILEPRNILDGQLSNVSYEINHLGLLRKTDKKVKPNEN